MTLENWANNSWLVRLESDRKEIEGLFAVADGHLADYEKAVASEMSSDAQLHFAYGAIRASAKLDEEYIARMEEVLELYERPARGIDEKGVVDTDQRKQQIVSQLLTVPNVHPSILSVEEIEDSPPTGSLAGNGPLHAYSVDSEPSPLEQYMREKGLSLDGLAAVSQQLLDGSLRIQQAETHISELRQHFADASQLPDDLQHQLTVLSQNYVTAIQAALDADQHALLSLGLGNAEPVDSPSEPIPSDGDLNVRWLAILSMEKDNELAQP